MKIIYEKVRRSEENVENPPQISRSSSFSPMPLSRMFFNSREKCVLLPLLSFFSFFLLVIIRSTEKQIATAREQIRLFLYRKIFSLSRRAEMFQRRIKLSQKLTLVGLCCAH